MKYRKLANTNLLLSEVTFGAWAAGGWMWGGADDDAAVATIQRALDAGITLIDTAPAYGQGHSEEVAAWLAFLKGEAAHPRAPHRQNAG